MHSIDGLISLIKLATDGGCLSQKQWSAEVLIELIAAVDKAVFEAVCADPTGMPLLISPKKARRLTAVTRAVLGLGLAESDGKRVFSIDAKQDQAQGSAERSQMASYLHAGVAALHAEDKFACTVDCTSVSSSEVLSLALTSQTISFPDGAELALTSGKHISHMFIFVLCSA